VLGAAEETALHDGPVASWAGWLVLVVGLLTVGATAAYVARLWLLTFFDAPRSGIAAHESSPAMRWPLVALAVPAAVLGFVGLRNPWLARWLAIDERGPASESARVTGELHVGLTTSVLSVALAAIGFAAVLTAWRKAPWEDPSLRLYRVRPTFEHAFWVDAVYQRLVVAPVAAAAGGVRWTDDGVIGATVTGTGTEATRLAGLLRRAQAGNLQTYLTGLLAGVVLLAVGVVTLT
jgi:NADH-quinone oxidoreductase subunit L